MSTKATTKITKPAGGRRFTRESKEEAVQLLIDGHTAKSVALLR